jgi:hypothetical protein
LGRPVAAARVEDHGDVVLVAVGDLILRRRGVDERLERERAVGRWVAQDDHLRRVRKVLHRLGDVAVELGARDDGRRAGVGEDVTDLGDREHEHHRHHDGACPADASVDGADLRDVREHHADTVARSDADAFERGREAFPEIEQFFVRVLAALEPDGAVLPELLEVPLSEDGDVHRDSSRAHPGMRLP